MLGKLRDGVRWRSVQILAIALAAGLFLFFLYGWRLGNLTAGMSPAEAEARHNSSSLSLIIDNPTNAPHRVIQLTFQHFGKHGAFWLRLVSVGFALAAIGAFYILTKWWFGRLIAFLGTLLFATTPWVVTLARSVTPDITLLSPLFIILAFVWLQRAKTKPAAPYLVLVVLSAVSIYVPGVLWFVVFGAIFLQRTLIVTLKRVGRWWLMSGVLLFLLIITPLTLAIAKESEVAKDILLIPSSWPSGVELLKSLGWSISTFVLQTRQHYAFAVGRLPILDIVQVVLVVVGVYAMWRKVRKIIAFLSLLVIVGIAVSTVNNNARLLLMGIPALSIIAAAGLRHLQLKWSVVFPHNPLARGLAISLMLLVVISHTAYGIRYALLAWPHSDQTRQTYILK